jgi:uncharacterized protein YdcH (DUF465 family)
MDLNPQFYLTAAVAFTGAVGSFFAVKFGQSEQERLLRALHGRFDDLAREVNRIDKEHVRLEERQRAQDEKINDLKKNTQRFRLSQPEPPMFKDGED